MFLGSSCCNIAENSTFARPLDFACRLNPSFHAFAEACATETLGAYAANETLGVVKDYANAKTSTPPIKNHTVVTMATTNGIIKLQIK